MALPSSGAISLNQVNVELSRGATNGINMNEADVRSLAGVPSGAISMSNLHGKSWWKQKTNGYTITWPFGATGNYYSAISPTGFKVQTIYWQIQAYNGNTFGFQATNQMWGQRQSDGGWEQIGSYTWSIGPRELKTNTATNSVWAGKENIIYTRVYVTSTNRDSLVRFATYLER